MDELTFREKLEQVKTLMEQLKSENARLKLQLEKVLEAFDVEDTDVPCPSNVGLNDSLECGVGTECRQCWCDALEGIGGKHDSSSKGLEDTAEGSGATIEVARETAHSTEDGERAER